MQMTKTKFQDAGKSGVILLLLLSLLCNSLAVHVQAAGIRPGNQANGAVNFESGQVEGPEGRMTPSEDTHMVSPGNGAPQDGLYLQNGRYLLYTGGVQVTRAGWIRLTRQELCYVNGQSYVELRLIEKDGIFWCYKYNYTTVKWEVLKNIWKEIEGKYYYFNKNGKCVTIYDKVSKKCQKYSGGKMHAVKKDVRKLKNGRLYYFNGKGVRVTAKGFQKASSKRYIQIGKSGYVTAQMKNSKGIWRYYKYNYKADKWKLQKSLWVSVDHGQYYFNRSGKCIKIYNTKTHKCKEYHKGKMRTVKKDICKLRNAKLYYFGKKGTRITKKGFQKVSEKQYIEIGKHKYVVAKLQSSKGIWKYKKYNYKKKRWEKQKNIWVNVDKKKFYFNGSGTCMLIYHTATGECYDYSSGTGQLVRNDVRNIDGTEYYFSAGGRKSSEAGLYLTCGARLVYAQANGIVTKEIFGQIQQYSIVNGKVANCRLKNGVYMRYYDGNADIRREIDTSRPMVALTYDDGPSQYTPEILSVLGQYNSVATFFVVGQRVPAHADIIRSAYQMGCEIGNHTYSHQVLTKVGASQIQGQIGATNSAVQNVTGVSPVVMRPPGGGQNESVRSAVGMPIIMWSIDTLDWKTRNAASTQAAVLDHVRDGDIVLMHDLYSQTAAASRVIIPELVNRGYQLVTISELSDCRGAMASGGVYSAFR